MVDASEFRLPGSDMRPWIPQESSRPVGDETTFLQLSGQAGDDGRDHRRVAAMRSTTGRSTDLPAGIVLKADIGGPESGGGNRCIAAPRKDELPDCAQHASPLSARSQQPITGCSTSPARVTSMNLASPAVTRTAAALGRAEFHQPHFFPAESGSTAAGHPAKKKEERGAG